MSALDRVKVLFYHLTGLQKPFQEVSSLEMERRQREARMTNVFERLYFRLEQMIDEGLLTEEKALSVRHIFSDAIVEAITSNQLDMPQALQRIEGKVGDLIRKFWVRSAAIAFSKDPIDFSAEDWTQSRSQITEVADRRESFATLFETTKSAARNGFVLEDKRVIRLDGALQDSMQKGAKVFTKFSANSFPRKYEKTVVEVCNEDTFDLAQRVQKEGFHPAVLNMASKIHPGGGVIFGWIAQEESLFLRSDYYLSLDPYYNPYLERQFSNEYLIPEFGTIYSPGVQVFRSSKDFSFQEPFSVDLIAAAAYKVGVDAPTNRKEYEKKFLEKIRSIFRTALETGHDSMVLGAYGCGAYKNDPKVVSQYFKRVLTEEEFVGRFRRVSFAVLNDANGKANFEIFSKTLHQVTIK